MSNIIGLGCETHLTQLHLYLNLTVQDANSLFSYCSSMATTVYALFKLSGYGSHGRMFLCLDVFRKNNIKPRRIFNHFPAEQPMVPIFRQRKHRYRFSWTGLLCDFAVWFWIWWKTDYCLNFTTHNLKELMKNTYSPTYQFPC